MRGAYGHGSPLTCGSQCTIASPGRTNGIGVNDDGSGIAIRSGSLGTWPMPPAAYPAKPTPSFSSMSTASTGTSFAHGLPVRVTNSARMNVVSDASGALGEAGVWG